MESGWIPGNIQDHLRIVTVNLKWNRSASLGICLAMLGGYDVCWSRRQSWNSMRVLVWWSQCKGERGKRIESVCKGMIKLWNLNWARKRQCQGVKQGEGERSFGLKSWYRKIVHVEIQVWKIIDSGQHVLNIINLVSAEQLKDTDQIVICTLQGELGVLWLLFKLLLPSLLDCFLFLHFPLL